MPSRVLKAGRSTRSPEPAEMFRVIADTIPHMLWTARPDGRLDYLNARILQYTGLSAERTRNGAWKDVLHPEDRAACVERWQRALTDGKAFEAEYRLRRADGKFRWHHHHVLPMRDAQGRIVMWYGTCTDIDERKRTTQRLERARQALESLVAARTHALEHSESRFRTLVDNAPVMVWESGLDKLRTFFNKPWLDYTGRTAEQEMGAGWAEGVHPEDLQRCLETYEKAFDARKPFEMEYRLRRHDGEYRWIVDRGEPNFDGAGEFCGYIGSCIDVTERRESKRARRESDQRLRAFLDSMPAIAWIKDSRFRYVWISASYGRVYGVPLDKARGRTDSDFWPEDLARHFRAEDEKALSVNGPVQSVDSVPYADGTRSRRLVVKFPLPDETGALGIAGIAFEFSPRISGALDAAGKPPANPLEHLSGRERQVLQLIVDGLTSAEVAARLNVSPKSIDTYRSRLMAKLGIDDLPSLVKFAIRNGLTSTR